MYSTFYTLFNWVGTNKFNWYGQCNSNVRFYIFTTTASGSSYQNLEWNKLELPCSSSSSKGFKAQLNEMVQLKTSQNSKTNDLTKRNFEKPRSYQRTWQKSAKPLSVFMSRDNKKSQKAPLSGRPHLGARFLKFDFLPFLSVDSMKTGYKHEIVSFGTFQNFIFLDISFLLTVKIFL